MGIALKVFAAVALAGLTLAGLGACDGSSGPAGASGSTAPAAGAAEPASAESAASARTADAGYARAEDGIAPLLEGIGPVRFPITSESPAAQAYFNQALTFSYGFNHAEAIRSFTQAAQLDPTCGVCWWGVALALGPNINAAMDDAAVAPAWEAVEQALALREQASSLEQGLIDAVATRYSESGEDRDALDAVYAGSMRALAERFPDNPHVLTLYAESLMDLYPWSYWGEDGTPKEHTDELVATLEKVIDMDASNPGAVHLYIHTMEEFYPEKAVGAADRLGDMVPVAGHLVHMPSHIYLRVGRYHDAVIANTAAALADEDYITQCSAQGFYPAAYYPHNVHFLWYSAMMEGQRELAVASARRLHEKVPLDMARGVGAIQRYLGVRAATYVRFGMWDEALAEPQMPEGLPMASFMRGYARGVAFAATGDLDSAGVELEAMKLAQDSDELKAVMMRRGDIAQTLTTISINLVEAEIAKAEGDNVEEVAFLEAAVAAQDSLPYSEPPFWHFPVRQALGAALLRAGDAVAAAAVFSADLEKFPNNGWSLYGLKQAHVALGRPTADLDAAHAKAWRHADIEPTTGP